MTKTKSQQVAEKALNDFAGIMKSYQGVVDTISKQKPFTTLDYSSLTSQLDSALSNAYVLKDNLNKLKIEIANLDTLITSIAEAIKSYQLIVTGLGNKANLTGKYGWFRYRQDLKAHNLLDAKYRNEVRLFQEHIDEPEADDTVSTKKILPVVQISQLVNDANGGVYDKISALFDKHEYDFIKNKKAAFATSLWLDANMVNILSNKNANSLAEKLIDYRVEAYAKAYNMTSSELRTYYEEFSKRMVEVLKLGIPSTGVLFSFYLSEIGLPKDKLPSAVIGAGLELPMEFDEIVHYQASLVDVLIANYEVQ